MRVDNDGWNVSGINVSCLPTEQAEKLREIWSVVGIWDGWELGGVKISFG